jgi:cyclopropane-fatty-acyl-phospholipid synthase
LKIADLVSMLTVDEPPVRFTAYDGSSFGSADAPITLELLNERGLRYLATAPGDLGLARAYVSGDLQLHGAHPGNPYDALVVLGDWRFRRPTPKEAAGLLSELGCTT